MIIHVIDIKYKILVIILQVQIHVIIDYQLTILTKGMKLMYHLNKHGNFKVEEFCHKHKTCLICDLNVNNQDVEHLLIYKKKLNFLGYLITWVVKFL